MTILFAITTVAGTMSVAMGLVLLFDDEAFGILLLIGGAFLLFVGIRGLYKLDHNEYVKTRAAIYNDLRAQHWHIKPDDVSGRNESVRIRCLKLDVAKLGRTWYVTVPRAATAGGGSIILHPSKERLLRKVC